MAGYLLFSMSTQFCGAQSAREPVSIKRQSPTKSIKQKIRAYLRRAASQARSLKNMLWGAGNFGDHYLRRITGLAVIATGASAIVAGRSPNEANQQVPPNKTPIRPTRNEEQQNPLNQQLPIAIKQGNDADALRLAVQHGDINVVFQVIDQIRTQNRQNEFDPSSPINPISAALLQIAKMENAHQNHADMIKALFEYLIQQNMQLDYLHMQNIGCQAIKSGNPMIIKVLLEADNKCQFFDSENITHLIHTIAQQGRPDLLQILVNLKGIGIISNADKKVLFDKTLKRFNNALQHAQDEVLTMGINLFLYHEIPFNDIWQFACIRNDQKLHRLLLQKYTKALPVPVNNNPHELGQELHAIYKQLFNLITSVNSVEVKLWLDIMQDNKLLLSTVVKNMLKEKGWHGRANTDDIMDILLNYELLLPDRQIIANYAIDNNNYRMIHKLLDKQYAQPDSRYVFFDDKTTEKLLHEAIRVRNKDIIKTLVRKLPYDKLAYETLWKFAASCNDNDELTYLLIDKRKKANANDNFVIIVLKNALNAQETARLKQLLQHKVHLTYDNAYHLLRLAIENKLVDHSEVLLEYNPYPDMVDAHMWQRAAASCNIRLLELLCNHKDRMMKHTTQAVELFIPKAITNVVAEFIIPTSNINDALRRAVQNSWSPGVLLLLSNGASCHITYGGDPAPTLLDKAIENNDPHTARVLIEAGAKISRTPLEKESDKKTLESWELNDLAHLLVAHKRSIELEEEQASRIALMYLLCMQKPTLMNRDPNTHPLNSAERYRDPLVAQLLSEKSEEE